MTQPLILVVEDDAVLRGALNDTLQFAGYATQTACDGNEAYDLLETLSPDLVVADVQLPQLDGHGLLKKIKTRWPEMPVMLMTAYGSVQRAVEAMRDGAVDYLTKPFEAEVLVNMVSQYARGNGEVSGEFIAADPASRQVLDVATRVAQTDATVMITGDSGTGKEVLARFIHQYSPRAAQPFVAINCAAIPENMLEATLFGYEKGAFTGAYKSCPGKFEQAQGGTLLLDEISEMDLGLQAKLLRVLQEREVERLGGSRLIQLDVRVLATSNRKMREEVAAGRFREDLYYRLNVFPLHLPELRRRSGDILPLADYLLHKHAKAMGRAVPAFTQSARDCLLAHPWPGNIREMDNVIQRTLILASGPRIEAAHIHLENANALPAASAGVDAIDEAESASGLSGDLRDHENQIILDALHQFTGNRQMAAEKLGISQRTLRYKLAKMREDGIAIPGRYGVAI
jgi:two-component system response regulator FlrC